MDLYITFFPPHSLTLDSHHIRVDSFWIYTDIRSIAKFCFSRNPTIHFWLYLLLLLLYYSVMLSQRVSERVVAFSYGIYFPPRNKSMDIEMNVNVQFYVKTKPTDRS